MECLPKNCRPYKGTKAEKQRQEHFRYQHPLHDANPEFCHQISDVEKKKMLKFSEKRARCFGVGKVLVVTDPEKVKFIHALCVQY